MWQKICVYNLDFYSHKLFCLARNLKQILPYSQLLLSCISVWWSDRKVQRYMNFVRYTFRLYPAQTFSKLFSLAFGAENPFCCKDATSVPMCVGWERGKPWGPSQSFCITATPICSKKILWGRLGCYCTSFVLPEWNENLGKEKFQSLVWMAHLKHSVI